MTEQFSAKHSPYYLYIDNMLNEVLNQMIDEGTTLSVSSLAKRCEVTRATVYHHDEVFSKLNIYREQQLRAKRNG